MIFNHTSHRVLTVFFLTLMFFLTTQTFSFAAIKDKQKFVMTEVDKITKPCLPGKRKEA